MKLEKRKYGFYGGNELEFDGRGFSIKMSYGEKIYLERNEASSLASLLGKLLFKGGQTVHNPLWKSRSL